ncbi:hypothetical protein ACH0F8_000575 [Enterococcus hirae]
MDEATTHGMVSSFLEYNFNDAPQSNPLTAGRTKKTEKYWSWKTCSPGWRFNIMSLMAVSLMEYFLSATHTLYQAGGATPSGDIGT